MLQGMTGNPACRAVLTRCWTLGTPEAGGAMPQVMLEIRESEFAAGGRRVCPADIFRKGP